MVPLVNSKRREQFERIKAEIAPDLSVHLLDGKARVAMIASDAALLASGTAALECMLAKCPMVVGYRMKPFTFWLAERLVKTPYVSLPNLLAGEELVTELLQQECQPQKLAGALLPLLQGGSEIAALKERFWFCIRASAVVRMNRQHKLYWSWQIDERDFYLPTG